MTFPSYLQHFLPPCSNNHTPIKGAEIFQIFRDFLRLWKFPSFPHFEVRKLNENIFGDSSNSLQFSQFFHIHLIVGFIIECIYHWWIFKLSTTFATFSHLPHFGAHYCMEILFLIVQLIYNLRSFLTLTPLWGSSLHGNSIGDTLSSIQLSQHFHINTNVWNHYWMKIALVILQLLYNFCRIFTFTTLWSSLLNEK